MARFVDGGKVVKITPPPPSPIRPALGGNAPLRPPSHDYHGEGVHQQPVQPTTTVVPVPTVNPQETEV